MELTDDRNGFKLQNSKRFSAIKGDNVISSIGAPLQTLGAPNTQRTGVRFPASPLEFSEIGYLLLPSRDMAERSLNRR